MARPQRNPPRDSTDDWLTKPCADPGAEVMRQVALNLRAAIGTRSLREVSRQSGVHHSVVSKVLEGTAWVEAVTIARLEIGLDVRLWTGV